MSSLLFSTIEVTRQAFYRTSLAFAIVNLKPIVPGHVLVIPSRVVPRLSDLAPNEIASLFTSVQDVGRVIERAYGGDGLTVACQDGKAAGQTIPHVHVHILPRKFQGDRFSDERKDDVYPELENAESALPDDLTKAATSSLVVTEMRDRVQTSQPFKVDADESRAPRSIEEMIKEAEWLQGFFKGTTGEMP